MVDELKNYFSYFTRTAGMSYGRMLFALIFSTAMGMYIFFIYRIISKESFYSKSFNISLPIITVLTATIVVAMQANLVVSLGMVGALSIVRFRTALKDPIDLTFVFWGITIGIVSGTELYGLALIASVVVTVALFALDRLNLKEAPRLLIVNGDEIEVESAVNEILKAKKIAYKIRSRNINQGQIDLIYEIKTDKEEILIQEIDALETITNVSILDHDGSIRY
ncbi:MAG: DUF4956 domain-containing protein [Fastidiosipilaceae bacterium]|jgi:uncharacterized membrane protein YhiD involved in acid resistance